jgi:hypothetical protein
MGNTMYIVHGGVAILVGVLIYFACRRTDASALFATTPGANDRLCA